MTRADALAKVATMTATPESVAKARDLIADPLMPPPDDLRQDDCGRIVVRWWGFDGEWTAITC